MFSNSFGDGFTAAEAKSHLSSWLQARVAEVASGKRADSTIPVTITIDSNDYYQGGMISSTQTDMRNMGVRIVKQLPTSLQVMVPISKLVELAGTYAFKKFVEGPGAAGLLGLLAGGDAGSGGAGGGAGSAEVLGGGGFLQQVQWGLPMWAWATVGGGLFVILIGLRMSRRRPSVSAVMSAPSGKT